MLYYKIEAELIRGHGCTAADFAASLAPKFEAFYRAQEERCYLYLCGIQGRKAVAGGVAREQPLTPALAGEFLRSLELECGEPALTEVTAKEARLLLRRAKRASFLADEDDVIKCFSREGMEVLFNEFGPSVDITERIAVPGESRAALEDRARALFCGGTLLPELERVFQGRQSEARGHPVHYIVQTDDETTFLKMAGILLPALLQNGRLRSQRFTLLRAGGWDRFHSCDEPYGELLRSCAGGAAGINCAGLDPDEDDRALLESQTLEEICRAAHGNRRGVLTVLWLPRACEKLRSRLMELLPSMSFVTLEEDLLDGEAARGYLRLKAEQNALTPNEALEAPVNEKPGQLFLPAELSRSFDAWYDRQLKTAVYAQYAEFESARKHTARQAPRGSAYEELLEMVGLAEAKGVITRALDYFKAQKLLRERGLEGARPAMHMVFTGSPGTAKTTAARLFARVMKENGLLPVGGLLEVGRGDLVGQYVGQTAPRIQAKFKAAKGSVLFIDEAYSLLDDREGCYGDEAISTIVQEMENWRDDVTVIFAGYPDKMEAFLRRNPGLRSRVAFHVPFADYSPDELCDILALLAGQSHLRLDEDVRPALLPLFAGAAREPDFGNGRYARSLLEHARMRQAGRLLSQDADTLSDAQLTTLRAEDFAHPAPPARAKQKVGF